MSIAYDDEVTAEQIAAIDALVAGEFASGDWVIVEGDGGCYLAWENEG